jgi:hypothetical protein
MNAIPNVGAVYEGVKKWSMVNSELSYVIGGGASRNHFLKMPRDSASTIEN